MLVKRVTTRLQCRMAWQRVCSAECKKNSVSEH